MNANRKLLSPLSILYLIPLLVLPVIASGIMAKSCAAAETATNSKNPKDKSMNIALKELSKVKCLCTAAIGEGREMPREYQLYLKVAALGPEAKPDLLKIAKTGSPAGRIYAAVLLYAIDAKLGLKTLKAMENCKDTMDFRSGCKGTTVTLGEAASKLHESGNFLGFTLGAK